MMQIFETSVENVFGIIGRFSKEELEKDAHFQNFFGRI